MFKYVGYTLKKLGTYICGILIALSIIAFIVFFILAIVEDETYFISSISVLLGGSLIGIIYGALLYGFGQLIQDTQINRQQLIEIQKGINMLVHAERNQGHSTAAPKESTPALSQNRQQAPKQTATQSQPIKNTSKIEQSSPITTKNETQADTKSNSSPKPIDPNEAKQQYYMFALTAISQNNYDVAYNAFKKIQGYKDSNEQIKALEEKYPHLKKD